MPKKKIALLTKIFFFFKIALFKIVFFLLISVFKNLNSNDKFILKTYKFSSDKIKKNQSFIFISDLHNHEFGKDNIDLIKKIREVNPDFILIGGDILTSKKDLYFDKAINLLKILASEYKIYFSNGNHELRLKEEKYKNSYSDFKAVLLENNIEYLEDSFADLGNGIKIYGLDISKEYYKKIKFKKMEKEYISNKFGSLDKNKYNILLAHSPNFFDAYYKMGFDLSLAGHFHGGTIRFFDDIGLMTPQIQFLSRNVVGLKKKGKSNMIISAGLGVHTIKFRVNNPFELIKVVLESRN